jgi:hypothetical protein
MVNFFDEDLQREIPVEEVYSDCSDAEGEAIIRQQHDLWYPFIPTFYQYEWYEHFTQRDEDGHFLKHLEGTAVVHRRAGKSTGVFKTVLLPRMLEERGLYVHAFPTLTQGKKAIWHGQGRVTRDPKEQAVPYLELIPRQLWKKKNNQEMSLELINGSVYQIVGIKGADGTADHLRGLNAIGVIADEYGEWRSGIMSTIFRPMMAQSGGFIFKIGTPKGENEFYQSYLNAKLEQETKKTNRAWLLTVDDTYYHDGERIVTRDFIERELALGTDPEVVQQEYYCSFKASSSGAYYKHQMRKVREEGRIGLVPHNPDYPVFRAWDIGKNGTNAAVDFQLPNDREIHWIGFCQDADKSLYEMHLDARRLDYVIDCHYYPWDGNSTESTGMTKIEFVRSKGVVDKIEIIPRIGVQAGIDYTRALFPRFLFDERNCHEGILCLTHYSKQMNKTTENYGDALKDEFIHGADAYRMACVAITLGMVPVGRVDKFFSSGDEPEYAENEEFEL